MFSLHFWSWCVLTSSLRLVPRSRSWGSLNALQQILTSWFHRRRGRWGTFHTCPRRRPARCTDSGRTRSCPAHCTSARRPKRRPTSPWSSCSCRRCNRRDTCTPRSDTLRDLHQEREEEYKYEIYHTCIKRLGFFDNNSNEWPWYKHGRHDSSHK